MLRSVREQLGKSRCSGRRVDRRRSLRRARTEIRGVEVFEGTCPTKSIGESAGLFTEPEGASAFPASRVKSAHSANRAAWWEQDLSRTATYLMGATSAKAVFESSHRSLYLLSESVH
jgi:hypothetical protein